MGRLTDNDKRFGPFTFGWCHSGMKLKSVAIENFGDDDDYYGTCLMTYFNQFCMRLRLPHFLKPYVRHVEYFTTADDGTKVDSSYDHPYPREYGISYMEGHMSFRYGQQTMDSSTTKSKGWFVPWKQWRQLRHQIFDDQGQLYFTVVDKGVREEWESLFAAQDAVPKRTFKFVDHDGQEITATTHIEEREWRLGEKWCKWLGYLRKPRISRSLNISFSEEVGPRKGSWKGGTIGHGVDMLEGENHEQAFRRYCVDGLFHARGDKNWKLTYVGELNE